MTIQMKAMVQAVKKWAEDHYSDDGWDYIVECFSDEDIQEALEAENVSTTCEAIHTMKQLVKVMDGRRKEIMAEVF